MKLHLSWIITSLFLISAFCCEAQVRPFLFTTSPYDPYHQKTTVRFDAGLGDGSLGFSNAPTVDSRIGVEWNFNSRWLILASTAFGKDESHTVLTGQIEGFYALLHKKEAKFRASAGGGVRWERDGGSVSVTEISKWMANAIMDSRYKYDFGKGEFTGSRSN